MKFLNFRLHILFGFFFLLWISVAFGQEESWTFKKKNHKLNRNYIQDLNQKSSEVFVKTGQTPGTINVREKEELSIFIIQEDRDLRFTNPDAIEIYYHYKDFNLGDLMPQVYRPIRYSTEKIIRNKGKNISLFP